MTDNVTTENVEYIEVGGGSYASRLPSSRVPTRRIPKYVDLGGGRRIESVQEYQHVESSEHGVFEVRVEVVFDESLGRFLARKMEIESVSGAEVTTQVLRSITVETKVRETLQKLFASFQGKWSMTDDEYLSQLGQTGPTDETLEAVAAVYRLAVIFGEAPAVRVARAFGVPKGTAARWVTRARDRGLLAVTDKRSKFK